MAAPSVEPDDELLLRIHSGDEQAFVALYRRRQGALYRFSLHMSGSVAVAEDVTQEVFMVLLRDGCGYDPERGTLSGYLFGIARKFVLRHLERWRNVLPIDSDTEEVQGTQLAVFDDPLAGMTRRESIESLRRAVKVLPRLYREVVLLCDLEELDYTEAALVLECPIGTVRSRLHRARALLLDKLQQERNGSRVGALRPVRGTT